jgi:cysteine synthase B
MQPDSAFNGLEGLKHMATAIVPKIYDFALADANIDMDTEVAYRTCRTLGRSHGLLVGISAGAAVAAAVQVAEQEARAGREAVIVTILPDSSEKYMSDRFWQEQD